MKTGLLNSSEWLSGQRYVCGIMTGTSLDGIDVAIAGFSHNGNKISLKPDTYKTYPFPKKFRDRLKIIINGKCNLYEISQLNFALAKLYENTIRQLCSESGFSFENIDAAGIHGQTIWHEPKKKDFAGILTASTFQSGSNSVLANLLMKPVVGDFRVADIALGGQGAPLVPIFDYEFLSDSIQDVIALNIGGIANLTYIPANGAIDEVVAFDTGPGNMLIDIYMKKYFNRDYDHNGETARHGKLIPKLFDFLRDLSFVSQKPPKSTGRELFNEELLDPMLDKIISHIELEDIIRTLTEFTVWCIVRNIQKISSPDCKLVVSGGGVHNKFMLDMLIGSLPKATVLRSGVFDIPPDAKEAMCFAYLAYRTLGGLHGNIPSVTGASRKAVLGTIALP